VNLNALAKKAAKGPAPPAYGGAMDVQDMIGFVLFYGSAAADEIERLQLQHQWRMEGLLPDGKHVVPFGRWALACIAFGRSGVDGLLPLLQDPVMASFAVAILNEVRTVHSIQVLVNYCAAAKFEASHHNQPGFEEWRAMSALSDLLGLDDYVQVDVALLSKWEVVLCNAFSKASTPYLQMEVLEALCGVPSESVLQWLQGLVIEDKSVLLTKRETVKTIRKRLNPDFKPLNAEQKRQLLKERALDV